MLPVFTSSEFRDWDAFTIQNEPIRSADLMERAAQACTVWLTAHAMPGTVFSLICGTGNNGGDGLAIARLLHFHGFNVKVWIRSGGEFSPDNQENLARLQVVHGPEINALEEPGDLITNTEEIILDCIFGTGLNKPVTGFWSEVIKKINDSGCKIISIDLPSGLPAEPGPLPPDPATVVRANRTLTFQAPKLSLLLPGWGDFAGAFDVLDIGLHPAFEGLKNPPFSYLTEEDIRGLIRPRKKFSHKGTYGHTLLYAGGRGKSGAAVMAAKACLAGGTGLLTVVSDHASRDVLQVTVPEAMTAATDDIVELRPLITAIGIGPGIGTLNESRTTLVRLLAEFNRPVVIDADGINILAGIRNFNIPEGTILTPHPKEADRLMGASENAFDRLKKASDFARQHKCVLVLKGAHTAICSPDGSICFNSTGNPGMAKGGSGDVLTGLIAAFLAQGYSPEDAARIAVYCHGSAGDIAAARHSVRSMTAGHLIKALSEVFQRMESYSAI